MEPFLLLLPPAATLGMIFAIQAAGVPDPWGPLLNSGVAGLMAWIFYRLTLRLLDEAKETREQGAKEREAERAAMAEIVKNNTAALGAYTQSVDKLGDGIDELKDVASDLREIAPCPLRQAEALEHSEPKHHKHGD